jgi:glycerol uptake facilitator-like aquaporin
LSPLLNTVALLLFFRRELSGIKMLCYWVAEFLGAMIASAIVWGCTSNLAIAEDIINRPPMQLGATTLNPDLTTANGFLLEFMGSFMFYFVIAQSALDKRGIASTPFPAIPIGLVLVVV